MADAALPAAAAKLLDFGQPMDVELLDATVAAFYGASSNEEVRWEGGARVVPAGKNWGSRDCARACLTLLTGRVLARYRPRDGDTVGDG